MINTQDIKQHIIDRYPYIGETRRRELSRLIYEIGKREKLSLDDVTTDLPQPPTRFDAIKKYLVERRYPMATEAGVNVKQSFADVDINPKFRMNVGEPLQVKPKNIFIEKGVEGCDVHHRMISMFPDAYVEVIESYREHRKRDYDFGDYNKRADNFYIIDEHFEFYKPCPCSQGSTHCGYHIVNLGSGCAFECTYCYLQDFLRKPGIMIPGNLDTFFDKFVKYNQDVRVGSGEATDSLLFDHITGFSPKIVNFFRNYPKTKFEFKTKSDNIDGLLSVEGARNIVVSWSMNPARIINAMEYHTASLDKRLAAARKCVEHGYSVAFHFDPMMMFDGWEEEYKGVVDQIYTQIPAEHIAWLSLGTLRMTPGLKKAIENRFPRTAMLDGEFLMGYDQKLRYEQDIRQTMYKSMMDHIRTYSKDIHVYLCMEQQSICSTQCSDGPTFTP